MGGPTVVGGDRFKPKGKAGGPPARRDEGSEAEGTRKRDAESLGVGRGKSSEQARRSAGLSAPTLAKDLPVGTSAFLQCGCKIEAVEQDAVPHATARDSYIFLKVIDACDVHVEDLGACYWQVPEAEYVYDESPAA
jgi:hypothetical protein